MAPSPSTLPWKYRLVEPHVAFWLLCLTIKVLLPSLLKFFAYDTISTTILSVWYPVCATITLIHRESQPTTSSDRLKSNSNASTQAARERKFWIAYWVAGFSLAQFVHQTVLSMPVLLRWSFQYSFLPQVMAEVKFLFFVWIFAMEPALQKYQRFLALDKKDAGHFNDFSPLTIIKRAIRPRLLDLQSLVSDPISKENWTRFIHSKAHKVLNLLVALQFLSEDWCDHLLHLLDECRSLLLLAPFLILPSQITRVGILYAQYLLPSARSLLARGKIIEVLYLQYWVLNVFFATCVSLGSWLWWFVPFSTQIVFAIWCYVTFPQTITQYYAVVETELIAFGVLSGETQVSVEETKTVQALRAVAKRIPSASDAEGFQWADSDSVDSRYGSRLKKKLPRANSAPATLLAISAMKAMHDSAMHDSASGMLSPQHETEEEDSETEPGRPPVAKKRPMSFSVRDRSFGTSSRSLSASTRRDSEDDNLAANVSIIVEDDEASQDSTKAMVNIDLASENEEVYDEVEVSMKALSAAKLRAAKSTPKSRSPQGYEKRNNKNSRPYLSPTRSSIMRQMSDEQKPRAASRRSASNTPRSNPSCGFEISDIDTTASSSAIENAESFDSTGAIQVPPAFRAASKVPPAFATAATSKPGTPKSTTMEDIARRAARRSDRIRKIQEKKEARKLNHLTESLLFMRSASTDESDTGKSFESMLSETSSSTGNRGLTGASESIKAPSPNRMRRRRQKSSGSEISDSYTPRHSLGSSERNVSTSSNSRKSSFPRYVEVDSSEIETRQRRARRSKSRDNMVSLDSDKVAQ